MRDTNSAPDNTVIPLLRRAPIRLRLTLWYVVLLALILALFATAVYVMLRQSLYSNLDDSIQTRASALMAVIQYDQGMPSLPNTSLYGDPNDGEFFSFVYNVSGQRVIGVSPVANVDSDVSAALQGRSSTRSVNFGSEDGPMRVRTFPITRAGEISGVLEVGQSEEDVAETLAVILLIMGIVYPVTLIVASFGGRFLAGRALSPIDDITTTARRISAEEMGHRLDLDLPDDEVGRLARTFDEMMQRLDDAFARQRQFTADASHELRTPLTVIKGQIEVSLQRTRTTEDHERVLEQVNLEVDRMIRMTGSLLTLARADAGQIPLTLEYVDLKGVLVPVIEHVRPIAENKNVDLHMEPRDSIRVRVDEDLLIQVMLNLLDNAIRHTPPGGRITVGWTVTENQVEMHVQDTGIGIASEHVPYIFERFYRVDKARSRAEGGVGLGLAISRWIAEAHGGSIQVQSTPDSGSTFTLTLPQNLSR